MSKKVEATMTITMMTSGDVKLDGHFSPRQALNMIACVIVGVCQETGISIKEFCGNLAEVLMHMDIGVEAENRKAMN